MKKTPPNLYYYKFKKNGMLNGRHETLGVGRSFIESVTFRKEPLKYTSSVLRRILL